MDEENGSVFKGDYLLVDITEFTDILVLRCEWYFKGKKIKHCWIAHLCFYWKSRSGRFTVIYQIQCVKESHVCCLWHLFHIISICAEFTFRCQMISSHIKPSYAPLWWPTLLWRPTYPPRTYCSLLSDDLYFRTILSYIIFCIHRLVNIHKLK